MEKAEEYNRTWGKIEPYRTENLLASLQSKKKKSLPHELAHKLAALAADSPLTEVLLGLNYTLLYTENIWYYLPPQDSKHVQFTFPSFWERVKQMNDSIF